MKQIYGIYEAKNLTKEQTKKYKMTKKEIFRKFDNLSKGELNTKNNKNSYITSAMTANIKNSRVEKKEVKKKKNRCFQKKPNDSRI